MARLVSPDQLKNWSRCKRKYYYQVVKKLNWPSDQRNFKLGKDVHKLMDYLPRGLDCQALLAGATDEVRRCFEQLAAHPIARLPVLASEWAFNVPVGNAWLVGRIDRIARHGDHVLIIDWKTGTATPRTPESDWQTLVYSYAVTEARAELGVPNLTADQVRFVYLEAKAKGPQQPVREVNVAYSATRHEEIQGVLTTTLAAMEAETEFALPSTCPDKYCAYRPICGIDGK